MTHPQPTRETSARFDHTDHGLPCPCCNEPCNRDSYDNGFGRQYGPWGCRCGWSEYEEYDTRAGEKRTEEGHLLDQYGGLTPNR